MCLWMRKNGYKNQPVDTLQRDYLLMSCAPSNGLENRDCERRSVGTSSSFQFAKSNNSTVDRAMRDIFRHMGNRKPSHNGVIVARKGKNGLQPPTMSPLLEPTRPSWPWEDSGHEDKSPGRAVEQASTPAFLKPSHRYRILCKSRDLPRASYLVARPDLMLIVSILIVAVWLFVCDVILTMCRRLVFALNRQT